MSSSERVQKDTTLQPQEEDRTNIDFVPDTGLIFIDTSAINWVYPGDYRGKSVGKYRALTTTHSNQILQLLQENPNIRTTREVVKEVYDTLVENLTDYTNEQLATEIVESYGEEWFEDHNVEVDETV